MFHCEEAKNGNQVSPESYEYVYNMYMYIIQYIEIDILSTIPKIFVKIQQRQGSWSPAGRRPPVSLLL